MAITKNFFALKFFKHVELFGEYGKIGREILKIWEINFNRVGWKKPGNFQHFFDRHRRMYVSRTFFTTIV